MRPVKQVKIISSQLEILEELKTKLDSLSECTNAVIQKGNSWIRETNNQTFWEINKFLTDETFECINKCQDITKDKHEQCELHSGLQEEGMTNNRTNSVNNNNRTNTSNPSIPKFDFKEEIEFKQLVEKCQEIEKTIALQSIELKTLHLNFQEHKNETKETIYREIKEATKKQESAENSFSFRLDEVMKNIMVNAERTQKLKYDSETLSYVVNEHGKNFDSSITNLQEKLKDLEEHSAVIESTCKKIEESNRNKFIEINKIMESTDQQNMGKLKDLVNHIEFMERAHKEIEKNNRRKFDDVYTKLKYSDTGIRQKFLNVSSQVDSIRKELEHSKLETFFLAQAYGDMNVKIDLCKDQIVTSFGYVLNNIGNHYDPTTGIFTAPCKGLYLCSLNFMCLIGENVQLFITIKESNGTIITQGAALTSVINSSSSIMAPLSLKQNDQVYVSSLGDYKQIQLHMYSFFMCALIHKS